MNDTVSGSPLISFIWKLMERISVQVIQFLIQIIMARILMPEDYGLIAIIIIFVNIANVLVQGGLNIALIQKKESDILDFSTVLFFTIFLSGGMIATMWLIAPYLATLFNNPILASGIRVYSLVILLNSILVVQNAIISKTFKFKLLFFASIISTITYGVSGIYFALNAFGVWALIYSQILALLVTITSLAITLRFIPVLKISFDRLRSLYKFSYKILISSLLIVFSEGINNYVIGQKYDERILGLYNKGSKFPILFSEAFIGSISAVYLPVLSKIQDDKDLVLLSIRKFIVVSSFLIFPAMFGLGIVARPLVIVLLTDKWLGAVPFIQFFCLIYAFEPIQAANYQVFAALGKSGNILRVELFRLLLYISSIVIFAKYGLYILLTAIVISNFIKYILINFLVKRLLNYKYHNQIFDLLPNIGIALIMSVILFFVSFLRVDSFYILLLQVTIGGMSYLGLAFLTKNKGLSYIIQSIKGLLKIK